MRSELFIMVKIAVPILGYDVEPGRVNGKHSMISLQTLSISLMTFTDQVKMIDTCKTTDTGNDQTASNLNDKFLNEEMTSTARRDSRHIYLFLIN